MTEPAAPSNATDEPDTAAPPARPRARYVRERVAVGALFFALTGYTIVNGATVIYRDTYGPPAVASPDARCSDGIHALYGAFTAQLATTQHTDDSVVPRRPSADPAVHAALAQLDARLGALRPVCDREGSEAKSAYEALTLWRYQAQDLSHVQEQILGADAEHALRYQSPPSPGAPSAAGTPP